MSARFKKFGYAERGEVTIKPGLPNSDDLELDEKADIKQVSSIQVYLPDNGRSVKKIQSDSVIDIEVNQEND